MWVIAYGSPWDGILLIGPFASAEEAITFAGSSEDPWELVEVHPLVEK